MTLTWKKSMQMGIPVEESVKTKKARTKLKLQLEALDRQLAEGSAPVSIQEKVLKKPSLPSKSVRKLQEQLALQK